MKHDALHGMWHEALTGEFGTAVEPIDTPYNMPHFKVDSDRLLEVTTFLKQQGFDMLLDVGGVDYLDRKPRFEVVYILLRMRDRSRLCLRCSPDDEKLELPSVSALWPSANPAEREVYDLFGIVFKDHPNLTRIMMPDDWKGYPLRKDYPLKGDREQTWAPFPADKTRFHAPRREEEGS